MSDEAEIITILGNEGDMVEFTVSATTAIAKGCLMYLSASGTASKTSGDGQIFCGIANVEKTATDGVAKMACITHCVANLTCGAAESMGFGEPVKTGAVANEVTISVGGVGEDEIENGVKVIGIALNDVAGNAQGPVLINVGKTR
jgi:hypothetical protein